MSSKKWDPERAKEAQEFIEEVTGEKFSSNDFHQSLKSGVLLCNFLNKLKPGSISKINKSNMAFMQMENIAAYVTGAKQAGVPDEYNFVTVDLFEGKDLAQVVLNVLSLKRTLGMGYTKQTKSSGTAISPFSTSDQTTAAKDQSSFVSREQTVADSDSDLKRTGPGYHSGRVVNEVALACQVCTKYITSGAVTALNRTWHPNCFTCKKCGVKLSTSKYYEHQNNPYCERCILMVNPQQSVKAATSNKVNLFNNPKQ